MAGKHGGGSAAGGKAAHRFMLSLQRPGPAQASPRVFGSGSASQGRWPGAPRSITAAWHCGNVPACRMARIRNGNDVICSSRGAGGCRHDDDTANDLWTGHDPPHARCLRRYCCCYCHTYCSCQRVVAHVRSRWWSSRVRWDASCCRSGPPDAARQRWQWLPHAPKHKNRCNRENRLVLSCTAFSQCKDDISANAFLGIVASCIIRVDALVNNLNQ